MIELACLTGAIEQCPLPVEEEGGVIIRNQHTGDMEFIKLHNTLTGTAQATCLFIADMAEFGTKVAARRKEGWRPFASFHTHPSFSEDYSKLDYNKLFQSYQINYIYSKPKKILAKYTWQTNQKLTKTILQLSAPEEPAVI